MRVPWELPLMQAPIGPATTPELVAGVSETGALGTLAASWTELSHLREQIRHVRAATDRPFCVNLVLAFDQRERLALCLEEGVPVVSFSWGIDQELVSRARLAGAFVLVQVGDVSDAEAAAAAGADLLVAQGREAGGHVQGTTATLELVRSVRQAVRLPVLAAGGIGAAAGLRAALDAGADAVACGTAFLAASEANVHPHYRDRIFDARATDTVLTDIFDLGWPNAAHRVLRNDTLVRYEAAGQPPSGDRPGEGDVVASRPGRSVVRYSEAQPTRETEGDIDAMAMYAGASVENVSRTASAAAIVKTLV